MGRASSRRRRHAAWAICVALTGCGVRGWFESPKSKPSASSVEPLPAPAVDLPTPESERTPATASLRGAAGIAANPHTGGPARAVNRGLAVLPYSDWGLEETAIDALGRIGEPAVSALEKLLHEPAPEARAQAAYILARIGPEAKKAVPQLMEALNDPNFEVRKAAARALGQIGPDAAPAVDALIKVIQETATVPATSAEPLPPGPTTGP